MQLTGAEGGHLTPSGSVSGSSSLSVEFACPCGFSPALPTNTCEWTGGSELLFLLWVTGDLSRLYFCLPPSDCRVAAPPATLIRSSCEEKSRDFTHFASTDKIYKIKKRIYFQIKATLLRKHNRSEKRQLGK